MLKKKRFEKCARTLCLNSPTELQDMEGILCTILSNCIQHPEERQYYCLKMNNKMFRTRVLLRKGGLEFLKAVGFCVVDSSRLPEFAMMAHRPTDDSQCLVLSEILCIGSTQAAHLEKCFTWLKNTVETSLEMAQSWLSSDDTVGASNVDDNDRPCAEYVIQIKLPTGETALGGFMHYDVLASIRSFASCYFNVEW